MATTTHDTRGGTSVAAAPVADRRRFRPDIDGLRAVAILLIVAFHAGVPGFAGGFVGVDVFFVISGFLITRNLLEDGAREGGRVRLLRFWGRRIRRLVPASTLMVLATLLASAAILPRFELEQVAKEGAASALYVSNILFARASQDYFAADVAESPFLHTWSLGVEEQFYLVWPLLFLMCALIVRKSTHRRRLLVVGFAALLVGSFAFNLRLTSTSSPWAFFSLPTRAWEFAIAGLVAALVPVGVPRSPRARTVAAVLGAALLVVSTTMLSSATAYPGTAALLPVFGTVLLIVAGMSGDEGERPNLVTAGLGSASMQWIGRLSYSWYLWHWPFIILTVAALDDDRLGVSVAAAAISLPVAYATHRLVENPIRFSPRLNRSVPATYAIGGVATLVVLGAALGLDRGASNVSEGSVDAKIATARIRDYPCSWTTSASGTAYCVGGDDRSSETVLMVGDSHAAVWVDAASQVARERSARLAMVVTPGCPATPVLVHKSAPFQLSQDDCAAAHDATMNLIDELQPTAVIITQSYAYFGAITDGGGDPPDESRQLQLWSDAQEQLLRAIRDSGAVPAVIYDVATLPDDPLDCIARSQAVAPCEPSRQDALASTNVLRKADRRVTAKVGAVPTMDPIAVLCNRATCALEVDDELVYADTDHLTASATHHLRPQLADLFDEVLRR